MKSSRSISGEKARQLVEEIGGTLDAELSHQLDPFGMFVVYQLADGKVLWFVKDFEEEPGALWISREAYLAFNRECDKFEEQVAKEEAAGIFSHHILEGQLPQGEKFVNVVPELIHDLSVKLRIPEENLDRSLESIATVEQAMSRRRYSRCLRPDIFAPLVAYVGEVMKQIVKGE